MNARDKRMLELQFLIQMYSWTEYALGDTKFVIGCAANTINTWSIALTRLRWYIKLHYFGRL